MSQNYINILYKPFFVVGQLIGVWYVIAGFVIRCHNAKSSNVCTLSTCSSVTVYICPHDNAATIIDIIIQLGTRIVSDNKTFRFKTGRDGAYLNEFCTYECHWSPKNIGKYVMSRQKLIDIITKLYAHNFEPMNDTMMFNNENRNNRTHRCGNSKCQWWPKSGPRLNIKTVLSTYGDFHVKDKTAVRTSYL